MHSISTKPPLVGQRVWTVLRAGGFSEGYGVDGVHLGEVCHVL